MKKEKYKISLEVLFAFVLGVLVTVIIASIWNYLVFARYPYGMMSGYMMPMMNMMGRGMIDTGATSCQSTDAQFEELGDKIMEQMMGKELDERMHTMMTNETTMLMHTAMGRMWSGC